MGVVDERKKKNSGCGERIPKRVKSRERHEEVVGVGLMWLLKMGPIEQ